MPHHGVIGLKGYKGMLQETPEKIPLFPLNAVLFPYGKLSLRIFEPRYLSMVSERMKCEKPFGVVQIREGGEAGTAASFNLVGTLARITDFDQLEDGLLGLSCQGLEKMKVRSHEIRPDQLIVGEVSRYSNSIDNDEIDELLREHQTVSAFLRQTLDQEELQPYRKNIMEDWADPDWISYQLAELLPMSLASRQLFLEMNTANRLRELTHVLSENNLL